MTGGLELKKVQYQCLQTTLQEKTSVWNGALKWINKHGKFINHYMQIAGKQILKSIKK